MIYTPAATEHAFQESTVANEPAFQECSVSTEPDTDDTSDCEHTTINDNIPLDSPAQSEYDITCSCVCCTNFDTAHQPTNIVRSESKQKSSSRSIQPAWVFQKSLD